MNTRHSIWIVLGCSFICSTICLELYLSSHRKFEDAAAQQPPQRNVGAYRLPQLSGKSAFGPFPFYTLDISQQIEPRILDLSQSAIEQTAMIDAEGPVLQLQYCRPDQLDFCFQQVAHAPQKLASPDQALPLLEEPGLPEKPAAKKAPEEQPIHRNIMREIIREELPDASQGEVEVWLKQMEDMTPSMARQMLQLRNKLSPPREFDSFSDDFADAPVTPSREPNSYVEEQILTPEMAAADLQDIVNAQPVMIVDHTVQSLMQARNTVLSNLANLHTTGYRRVYHNLEPIISQVARPGKQPHVQVDGMRIAKLNVSESQGNLEETGRELHVAIDGMGYFQINDGSRMLYTRAGNFSLNDDGQVGLIVQENFLSLEPPITPPMNYTSIAISEDGAVFARTDDQQKPTAIGSIQLARFPATDALVPVKGCLYSPGKTAGKPVIDQPTRQGMGRIHQGFLEGSNVDSEQEMQQWYKLNQQIQMLMSLLRSSTGDAVPMPRHAQAGPQLKLQK